MREREVREQMEGIIHGCVNSATYNNIINRLLIIQAIAWTVRLIVMASDFFAPSWKYVLFDPYSSPSFVQHPVLYRMGRNFQGIQFSCFSWLTSKWQNQICEINGLNARSQYQNVHPRKLDHKISADGPSAKIGPLENFWLYGIYLNVIWVICMGQYPCSSLIFKIHHLYGLLDISFNNKLLTQYLWTVLTKLEKVIIRLYHISDSVGVSFECPDCPPRVCVDDQYNKIVTWHGQHRAAVM